MSNSYDDVQVEMLISEQVALGTRLTRIQEEHKEIRQLVERVTQERDEWQRLFEELRKESHAEIQRARELAERDRESIVRETNYAKELELELERLKRKAP